MRSPFASVVVLCLLAACGGDSPTETEQSHIPLVGTYDYAFTWHHPLDPGNVPSRTQGGVMTITYATEDSIAGSWSVVAYDSEMSLGFWNVDAYVVYAHMGGAVVTHRLSRRRGSNDLDCEAGVLIPVTGGYIREEGSCTVVWVGGTIDEPPDEPPVEPAKGTIEATVLSTGTDPDLDGYTVYLDGVLTALLMSSGSVILHDVSAGDHILSLSDLAQNCSVDGSNPRTVSVTGGQTSTETFNVVCVAVVGQLRVSVQTTQTQGGDPSGYIVEIDTGQSAPIGINETKTVDGIPVGVRTVTLTDVDPACVVAGDNPKAVGVSFASTAETSFAVVCP